MSVTSSLCLYCWFDQISVHVTSESMRVDYLNRSGKSVNKLHDCGGLSAKIKTK